MIERLKEYIDNDISYKRYKNYEEDFNDFEKFCIQHCEDIERLLIEYEELKKTMRQYTRTIKKYQAMKKEK